MHRTLEQAMQSDSQSLRTPHDYLGAALLKNGDRETAMEQLGSSRIYNPNTTAS